MGLGEHESFDLEPVKPGSQNRTLSFLGTRIFTAAWGSALVHQFLIISTYSYMILFITSPGDPGGLLQITLPITIQQSLTHLFASACPEEREDSHTCVSWSNLQDQDVSNSDCHIIFASNLRPIFIEIWSKKFPYLIMFTLVRHIRLNFFLVWEHCISLNKPACS